MMNYIRQLPENTVLGTTLETNRSLEKYSQAPNTYARYYAFASLPWTRKMVSIDPIMQFDLDKLVMMIQDIRPEFVSIGADSDHWVNRLPEPHGIQIQRLIGALEEFTEVRRKKNLRRLLG